MRRYLIPIIMLFLFTAGVVHAQENAARYLDTYVKKYVGLKDYSADVLIHYDITALKAPDRRAKVYYKSPDKVKFAAKGIFFFPKQGGYFNPAQFNTDNFEIKIIDHVIWNDRKAVRLQLLPKDITKSNQRFILTIDMGWHLIQAFETVTSEGRKIKAIIVYEKFGEFDLPTHIELQLEDPPAESGETKELIPFGQHTKQISGKVFITYANYKVNTGLKDEFFAEPNPELSQ
ncbi:MAG: hypothetical protein A2Z19_05340 [Deltaproteobacteria bacterium RBG_16_54_18]|nr:MAG: hypothetical protein A2Z19_05340 [Deltaproteobacteria bacterium RBG_16_54_18]